MMTTEYHAGRSIIISASGYRHLPIFLLVTCREASDIMGTILLILLVLLLIGAIPSWPYSRSWGFAPSGVLGVVLVIVVVLLLLGRI